MSELLTIDDVTYISASNAGKNSKYTSDYITKLARDEKITATRVGRQWYVSPESLQDFIEKTEEEKIKRGDAIREERKQEQLAHTLKSYSQEFVEPVHLKRTALQATLVILFLGLSLGIGGYTVTTSPALHQEANVADSFVGIKKLALSLYHIITPMQTEKVRLVSTEPTKKVDTTQSTTTYTSIITAPSDVFTASRAVQVRDSFSDQVDISVDPNNPDTGIIVPIFRDHRGDQYRFLMMPINPPSQNQS